MRILNETSGFDVRNSLVQKTIYGFKMLKEEFDVFLHCITIARLPIIVF